MTHHTPEFPSQPWLVMSLTHRTSHQTINLGQIRVTGTDPLGTHPNQHTALLPSSRCSIIVLIPREAGRKGAESHQGAGIGEQRGGQAGHPRSHPHGFPRASLQPGGPDAVHPRPEASPWPPGRDRDREKSRETETGRQMRERDGDKEPQAELWSLVQLRKEETQQELNP